MRTFRSALAAATLLAGIGLAYAQPAQTPDPHHPDAAANAAQKPAAAAAPSGCMEMCRGMSGANSTGPAMPMMQMMGNMTRARGMQGMSAMPAAPGLRHIEGQIAFYRAELRITDAQGAVWNSFADALRAGAKPLQEAFASAAEAKSVPALLAARRQMLDAELSSLQTIEPAARDLYAALSVEQKKTADEFMADHLRRM